LCELSTTTSFSNCCDVDVTESFAVVTKISTAELALLNRPSNKQRSHTVLHFLEYQILTQIFLMPVSDLATRRPDFYPRPVNIGFLVNQFEFRQVFMRVVWFFFYQYSIIPPLFLTYFGTNTIDSIS